MSRLPLRVRLVAGFVLAMLVLLTAAGAFVYWRVEYALDRGLDTELVQATSVVTPLVDATGQVTSPAAADATGAGWQVFDEGGQLLETGGTAPAAPLVTAGDLSRVGRSGSVTRDIGTLLPVADEPFRVRITALGDTGRYLVTGVRRDHRDEALRELLLQLTLAGLGALAVAAVVGDLLARAALRPVERYRRRAEEIAGGATGLRLEVPVRRDDEVTRLGHTLNDMLIALERSLDHERRFVDDASHELRTPLTLLTSRIQLARRRPRPVEEHEAVLDELGVDVARLTDLAEQLLALGARDPAAGATGAISDRADTADTDVALLVRDLVARRRLAHPDDGDRLTVDLPSTPAHAAVDPATLERILVNLLDNAHLHGRPPVGVRVRVVPEEPDGPDGRDGSDWTVVEVRDAGPGMPPDLMARATERFTRSVEARSRPGAGLGLSIVDQLVLDTGGELRLCHGHDHSSHGRATPGVRCEHSTSMTATVILTRRGPSSAGHESEGQ